LFLANPVVDERRRVGHRAADRFPLTYYRDNCADIELTIDDVLASPVADSKALLISGTGLSKEPSRSATLFAAKSRAKPAPRWCWTLISAPTSGTTASLWCHWSAQRYVW